MKRLLLIALFATLAANAKQWNVNVSYYGNVDFAVSHTDWTGFNPATDTVTYKVDGPGTLFLEDDYGRVYYSRTGEVTLNGWQMATAGKLMRCSLVTPDGELLGWQMTQDDRMGGNTSSGGSGNADVKPDSVSGLTLLVWLMALWF